MALSARHSVTKSKGKASQSNPQPNPRAPDRKKREQGKGHSPHLFPTSTGQAACRVL